ncbi:MAG: COR domain-containing protein [Synechococcus sp.]
MNKAAASPKDILNYYFSLVNYGSSPLNEGKLILVGFGAVGKTSLVNRLIDGRFNPSEAVTDGINITEWPIQIHPEEDIRLNIWDFGGQEIMHSTHQFFLTERSLYLLVLNGRQGHEDEDAEYWLNLIRSFGRNSPVIVVLNKFSEIAFNLNRSYLCQKFPNIRHFIETDCSNGNGKHPHGRNIGKLKNLIAEETDQLENLRIPFPGSWFNVKNYLAEMPENFISFERFRQLCQENGEPETDKQNSLANILHQLGISLNYREDPRLRDTQILNPHWVTNGIYTILNDERLSNCKGDLLLDKLDEILDRDEYPTDRYGFLLELMRKFELAFRIDESETRYLVTDLLDKQQPSEAETFNLEACLNFQFQYPTILPAGIIPRFITRTYPLSTDINVRWRTGVILKKNGNRALVVSDRSNKRIDIAIDGPIGTRQELLAIIRYDFERIHSSFSFKPAEQVPIPGHPEIALDYNELRDFKRDGIEIIPKSVDGKTQRLNVQELLEGVDLPPMPNAPLKLFYSYSHEDEALRDQLETHLKLLQREGHIAPWHDRRITAGDEWKDEIDTNLEQADIVLLLISADFIASDYCYEKEGERALERRETGKTLVIPVILRECDWQSSPFSQLQALPKNIKPITRWDDRDSAWADVAKGIRNAIAQMQASS